MTMRLTQQERSALEWLQRFTENLLAGKPTQWTRPTLAHLDKMGIKLNFVTLREVKTLIRGKEKEFPLLITNAPCARWLKGVESKHYLSFQIKEKRQNIQG
ncbi:hypothetical protein [Halopseudomonas bauzanensis]|uniref:Uncharacterized protein n=1 Tax=Halopseudomonas bauzanensis TaxID=653930 RepID=A0A1H9TUP6_9GAMM|nr:hypothetical protein [Halopseudomonas bauzanensis]SES00742.1 hypothetical protein SAMN05216589_1977 [Halopseudomonas bauzanensis]SFM02124.1 hypothetical protein SAMN04487855_1976 [Halopseudomonas bauzanensis]